MNIILCGLPKSGKTTIGKHFAENMKWDFIDTDILIEKAYARSTHKKHTCRQIYFEEGEAFFRNIESLIIGSLANV